MKAYSLLFLSFIVFVFNPCPRLAAQGALENGGNHEGATFPAGDEDTWTFTAAVGDNITLRCGEISGTASYYPYLRLIGPTGVLIAADNDTSDSYINHRATNSGTFTVVVGSWFAGQTGSYNLRYMKAPGAFIVPAGDEGGTLTNGANHLGVTLNGDEDMWTFTANVGENITLRCGEVSGTASYNPYLRLIGPTGVLIATDNDALDSYINHRATNSGTYAVLVGSWFPGQTGTYSLRYAKAPGDFVVPSDDEGGPLTNGANHLGTNSIGDEDIWSFTAAVGDNITLRVGEISGSASYNPYLRLIGPTGVLVAADNDVSDSYINYRATNAGTYVVLVGSWFPGHTGSYSLRYVNVPAPFIVPPGDEGGALTNGANHLGTTSNGDEDIWTFTANVGDNITLRCGELTGSASYNPYVRLIGPTGVLIAADNDTSDSFINYRATNSGIHTVIVGAWFRGQTGTYNLRYVKAPGAFVVPSDDEGGPLTNGGNHLGTNSIGDEDMWSFTAAVGDNITLRCGEVAGSSAYNPYIRLYGPTGVLVTSDNDASDSYINYRATNAGSYTVVVGSWFPGHTGSYNLRFVQAPGNYVVPGGDEGGVLTNGGNHTGTNTLGDEDIWTFTANSGDDIILRCGELAGSASYFPWVRLIGPSGIAVGSANDNSDSYVNHRATNSGTYTVLVGSYFPGQTGAYSLRYLKVPGPFIVPPGDEGGGLTGSNNEGAITLGDEDIWRFTLCSGEPIALRCTELSGTASFYPWVRLYGPSGTLIAQDNDATESIINHTTTNGGTYTVVVGSWFPGHTGTYRLTHNNLDADFKNCVPRVRGTNVTISAVGGAPGQTFVALTSTEVTTPLSLWVPFLTNQFDQLGTWLRTNRLDLTEPRRFYILRQE